MIVEKELVIDTTSIVAEVKESLDAGYPIIVNEGGSGSGKTYGTIQLLIYLALEQSSQRISVVSHSLPHLKRGALRDFKLIMQSWEMWSDEKWSATNFIYTFENDSYIEFIGLEDEGKARGPRRDYLFVNEANLISKQVFDQLAMRTAKQCIIDLNPADFNCWCYDVADDPKNKKIHSTYLDNIENLSANQISYIEAYKSLPDDFMWKVYGLGLRGAAKELIFTQWKVVKELPGKGDIIYGIDFGFTHPCAMVRVELYDGCVYAEELLYRSGLTITDVCNYLKTLNIGKSPIYADAAEPKSIEEIKRYGFNIHKADKDVWAGILKLKSMPIFVLDNSHNLKSELSSYKWKKDSNDNLLEEPVKINDDLCDSMRYAVFTHLTQPKSEWVWA